MVQVLKNLSWESEHFAEKVRVGLLWPTTGHVLIGLKETILVWDGRIKATVDKICLSVDILDMKYVQVQNSEFLAVLVVNGHHIFFKVSLNGKFSEQKSLNLRVHKKLDAPVLYGVLACSQDLIASSLGNGVIVRNLRVPKSFLANIKHSYLFTEQSPRASVTQLLLIPPARLLVLSASTKLLVEYDLSVNSLTQIISLDYYPMYLTYSSVKKLVVINDPLSGSHFMDAVSFKTEYTLSHVTANVDDRPLPSYLCFNEVGNGCAIAEHNMLRYHQITNSGVEVSVIPVTCVRFYGLMVSRVCNNILQIVAIVRPSRKREWKIQVWSIISSLPENSFKWIAPAGLHNSHSSRVSECSISRLDDTHHDLQMNACDYGKRNAHRMCTSCWQANILGDLPSIQECRFLHFRLLRPSQSQLQEVFLNIPTAGLPHSDKRVPRGEREQDVISIAQGIRPLLIKELIHIQRPGLLVCPVDDETYRLCDICYVGHFFEAWYCGFCGFETCGACYESLVPSCERDSSLGPCPVQHAQSWFIPISYFTERELNTTMAGVDAVLATPLWNSRLGPRIEEFRNTSSIPVTGFELIGETFLKTWSHGDPFLLADAIQEAGLEKLSNLSAATDHLCPVEFFDGYSWQRAPGCSIEEFLKTWTVKQNWPRRVVVDHFDRSLRQSFPDLQEKIDVVLRRLSLTMGGSVNIFTSLPFHHGGSSCMTLSIVEGNSHIQGADPLQFNPYGTIHVMLDSAVGSAQGAEWDLWHKESLPSLSRALDPSASEMEWKIGLPVHKTPKFVSSDLSEVAASFGHLRHWKHIQKPGDALFVPPGCCYQISHLSSCVTLIIKLVHATDVSSIQEITERIRSINLLQNTNSLTEYGFMNYYGIVGASLTIRALLSV